MKTDFSCKRPGTIIPLLAISLVALIGMTALAVDIGIIALAKNNAQLTADAAAFAGARTLNGLASEEHNYDGVQPSVLGITRKSKVLGKEVADPEVATRIGYYNYDNNKGTFTPVFPKGKNKPASDAWSTVEATVKSQNNNSFFAKIFNFNAFDVEAKATAVHKPRDISIVLDFSGSMRFNSLNGYPFYDNILGSMNPDRRIPKFGHWSQPSMQAVMQGTVAQPVGSDIQAPANLTVTTDDGPPIVLDFSTLDERTGVYKNAFHQEDATYDWRLRADKFAVPAPERFGLQTTAGDFIGNPTSPSLAGDPWPRLNGNSSSTLNLNEGFARTVQEYLNRMNTIQPNPHARNASFEDSGFDKRDSNYEFQGFTVGPGYYGKTFYLWPPDPRPAKDWRKKFFLVRGANSPNSFNLSLSRNSSLWSTTDGILLPAFGRTYQINYEAVINWIKSGPQVFPPNLRAGRVLYYSAIPDFPSNQSTGGSEDQKFWRAYIDYVIGVAFRDPNSPEIELRDAWLYGTNTIPWGGNSRITNLAATTTSPLPYMHYNDNPVHPRLNFWFGPLSMLDFLSCYQTFHNWLPGTCHESATWQLKAGIQSSLTYLEKNHPNDQAALIYFSSINNYNSARVKLGKDFTRMKNALFYPFSLLDHLDNPNQEIRPYHASFNAQYLGIDNYDMFFWDDSSGEIPNAAQGTCPQMGFMVAYNEFCSFAGFNGRQGASKMVILETDGRPTSSASANFVASNMPFHHRFQSIQSLNSNSDHSNNALMALRNLCNSATRSQGNPAFGNSPGYSTTKSPVRAHALAFGYLFEPSFFGQTPSSIEAMEFLVNVQKIGGTSRPSATSLEDYKIITGDFNSRIDKLRTAFERILQSGVQITLIE